MITYAKLAKKPNVFKSISKVENTLAELKHFKVLADRFRHNTDIYDDTFRSVVALVNPRISRRLLAAA